MTRTANRTGITTTVTRYCLCGGALTGKVSPPSLALAVIGAFDQVHNDEDCGPATAAQAAAARRREDRLQARSRKDWWTAVTRTDPGATSGNQNYATNRGPCATCFHSEASHRFVATKVERAGCTVTNYLGACSCKAYEEVASC